MAALKFFLVASFLVACAFSEQPENQRVKKDILLRSAYVAPTIATAPALTAPLYPAAPIAAPLIPATARIIPAVHTIPTAYSTSYRIDYPRYLYPGLQSYLLK